MASSTRRQRGYPVEIFGSSEVNEKFLCTVCHLVLRHAVQRYCGHRYCKDCVETAADTACPACEREGLEEELPPDEIPQVCKDDCGYICSVLFFSSPRSEGGPYHERTFFVYLWLTLPHGESCPRLDVVRPWRTWSSSPACTWHCSLSYLFLQATPVFPRGVTQLKQQKSKRWHYLAAWVIFQPRRFFWEHLIGHFTSGQIVVLASWYYNTVCSVWRLINSTTVPTRPNVTLEH